MSSMIKPNQGASTRLLEFPQVHRRSLRVQVREALEDLIVYGQLAPGEHLAEESLAEQLGVSRQPVREALQTMAGAGFVDLQPGRGAFVHRPTVEEVRDVFHVRGLLEADGAALAARNIDDDGRALLESIYARGEAASSQADSRELIELNTEFHDAVMSIGDNKVSIKLLSELRRRIGWYLATIITSRAPSSWVEHRGILDAINSGDAEQARLLMSKHITHSKDLIEP